MAVIHSFIGARDQIALDVAVLPLDASPWFRIQARNRKTGTLTHDSGTDAALSLQDTPTPAQALPRVFEVLADLGVSLSPSAAFQLRFSHSASDSPAAARWWRPSGELAAEVF